MIRTTGNLITAAAFGSAFLATLGMDGSLHYPLAYPQVLLAAIALAFIISAARDWHDTDAPTPVSDAAGGPVVLWLTMALCIAYAASWTVIGFFPATFVYVAAQLWLLRQRHWPLLLGVPATVILVMYVVFDKLLAMPFPSAAW